MGGGKAQKFKVSIHFSSLGRLYSNTRDSRGKAEPHGLGPERIQGRKTFERAPKKKKWGEKRVGGKRQWTRTGTNKVE